MSECRKDGRGYGGMWWKGCGAGLLQAGGGYEAEGDGFHDHVGGVGGPELAHDVVMWLRWDSTVFSVM